MTNRWGAFKTTVAGGVLFLLPLVLILFLLNKALDIARKLAQPVVNAIGVETVGGVALGTIVGIATLVILSFLAGLAARTRAGQATYSGLEKSILGVLPQWRMARGLIESFGAEQNTAEVVLVPTDAGWCMGFVLEKAAGDWWTVFIPGAPQWTSGSISYAHADQVHRTDMTFAEAVLLMRRCGAGSAKIQELLASLKEKNAL